MRQFLISFTITLVIVGCSKPKSGTSASSEAKESKTAKALLQGIWIDKESEDILFRAEGDTIFYPDSTSQPAFFRVVNDSLVLGDAVRYPILKQSEHVFWFRNQSGDTIKLVKSENPEDLGDFAHDKQPKVMLYTDVMKIDSVVMYGGERYHWYIAINPTKYKVVNKSYNDEGMEVNHVYYDNLIHVSVFKGGQRLFAHNFRKQMYAAHVPADFLEQAILSNMEFDRADASGFRFNATLCVPNGASCYMVATNIGYDGKMTMKLIEY